MDPAQEAEAAAVLQRLMSDVALRPLAEVMAEIEQLPPVRQCAVLGHDYPQTWTVGVDGGIDSELPATYYARSCRRCGSIEVADGRSWPF